MPTVFGILDWKRTDNVELPLVYDDPLLKNGRLFCNWSYFESAPNHDAVGLRVADDGASFDGFDGFDGFALRFCDCVVTDLGLSWHTELAQSIYTSMISIPGLRPCDFTIPNFPGT